MPLFVRGVKFIPYHVSDPACILFCRYNLRQADISVLEIAFQRSAAVIVGVIWAAIVSRFWWPAEAPKELSRELGEYVSSFPEHDSY